MEVDNSATTGVLIISYLTRGTSGLGHGAFDTCFHSNSIVPMPFTFKMQSIDTGTRLISSTRHNTMLSWISRTSALPDWYGAGRDILVIAPDSVLIAISATWHLHCVVMTIVWLSDSHTLFATPEIDNQIQASTWIYGWTIDLEEIILGNCRCSVRSQQWFATASSPNRRCDILSKIHAAGDWTLLRLKDLPFKPNTEYLSVVKYARYFPFGENRQYDALWSLLVRTKAFLSLFVSTSAICTLSGEIQIWSKALTVQSTAPWLVVKHAKGKNNQINIAPSIAITPIVEDHSDTQQQWWY